MSLNVYDLSSLRQFKRVFRTIFSALGHLTTSDAIVFNSPPVMLLLFPLFLAKILRKKTVFICHGGIFFECSGLLNQINRMVLLIALRNKVVQYVVVPSGWLAKFIKNQKVRSEVSVIPNGIDTEEIDSFPPTKLATKNNILFLGRLAKIKGLSTLVDAFYQLANESQEFHLYIVGPKGDLSQDEVDRIQRLPNIHLLGKISHERKFSLMKGVDIVVIPSLWENFPLVLLEAMACAKPVIATSVGGIPEIINKKDFNGVLVPPSNSRILAKTIKNLLTDDQSLAKLSENSYSTAKNKYDWKNVASIYLDFLTSVANY